MARTFTLRVEATGERPPQVLQFEDVDPHKAFFIIEQSRLTGPVTLWVGEERLGTLSLDSQKVWTLS